MRKSLLLYLFVFAVLVAIFAYVNGQQMLRAKEEKIELLEQELLEQEKTADSLRNRPVEQTSFSFIGNEAAFEYFEQRGMDPMEVKSKIENALISGNRKDADHDLIPYEGMNGFFRINKIKLLNHKWLIASFTDGTYWGDIFISYEVDEQGRAQLQTEKAVLYPGS